jgi:hypothetical protein
MRCLVVRLSNGVHRQSQDLIAPASPADGASLDRPNQAGEPLVSEEQRDSTVLTVMLCEKSSYPWSVEEIARTIHSRIDAIDSVCCLEAAGLVHRIGAFLFPTLAARRADELGAGAI